ncbi:arylsulfatase A family protein [Halovivax ruber XH-70]|uniref:Arylsulfatase A family protein n=1 Tax=Halovivax ruber (strain DSM 18193 / JCM 13892 / XH-70) TaxID=797302 RepID=L0I9Y1_HALRX|nr:sulfatase-like hydrolase/transferase [Halovivax ruber]AGB14757.1 arylsulfatase A family protein [Halovivax ruber XH-70]
MADAPPNILLALTDQERYDVSAPEGPPVETPAMDRLAAAGMRFTNATTPTSICTSARASLLTGQFPHGHGMLNNHHEGDAIRSNLDPEIPTFSQQLAEAGYALTYTGKWHVGHEATPEKFGFAYRGGSDDHHDDALDDAFARYREERGLPLGEIEFSDAIYTAGEDGTLVAATTPVPVEATRAHFLADRTIEAIGAHSDAGRPFFHRADFYGPHHPYVIPEPYASMYDPADVSLPASYAETFDGKPRAHEQFLGYRGVADFDRETWREVLAKYWGFVSLIDDEFGRVIDALDDHGLADDTVVVHAADHGDFVGGHRQFNKGPLMYDDTYRIPLQVRWPGEIEPGTTCEAPVHVHDLAATFCELADVPVPESFHARSLVPLLSGRRPHAWPDSTFGQYSGEEFGLYTQRLVRTERYTFVYNGPDVNELYDREADPAQLQNLIDHPDYADVRGELADRLVAWMDATDDPYRKWVPKTFS